MISEKDKKIVDAVNWLEGDIKNLHNDFDSIQDRVIKNGRGEFFGAKLFVGFEGWSEVCSMKDMLDFIREMSAGKFVTPCELTEEQAKRLYANIDEQDIEELIADTKKPEFEYGQRVFVDGGWCKSIAFYFGCLTLCGESAILLSDKGHVVTSLSSISATPFKPKKEIEMEEAKKNQVGDYSYMYSHYFENEEKAQKMFLQMQNRNELSEIILPLEGK